MEKGLSLQTRGAGKSGSTHVKVWNWTLLLYHSYIHKNHWKLIKDLSIISKKYKASSEKQSADNIGTDSDVLTQYQKYKQQKQRKDK